MSGEGERTIICTFPIRADRPRSGPEHEQAAVDAAACSIFHAAAGITGSDTSPMRC